MSFCADSLDCNRRRLARPIDGLETVWSSADLQQFVSDVVVFGEIDCVGGLIGVEEPADPEVERVDLVANELSSSVTSQFSSKEASDSWAQAGACGDHAFAFGDKMCRRGCVS